MLHRASKKHYSSQIIISHSTTLNSKKNTTQTVSYRAKKGFIFIERTKKEFIFILVLLYIRFSILIIIVIIQLLA